MSFNNANLTLPPIQTDNGSYLWVYVTSDSQSDLNNTNYFGGAFGRVRAGDLIHITASDGEWIYRFESVKNAGAVTIDGPIITL